MSVVEIIYLQSYLIIMADIQLLLKLGRELDLSGQERRDWVDRKAAEQKEALDFPIAQEERAAERELKKLELEAQIAKASSKDSPGSQNSAP